MTNKDLAELIFPNLSLSIEDIEKKYPMRNIEGEVTRFAPSPTGYMHIGGTYQALTDYMIAKNTNGIFYLRNEDTDKKREIEKAVEIIIGTLEYYGIKPDEYQYKEKIIGNYGPYIQSERKEIYHAYIKYLIEIGRAYPCFCSKEELDNMRKTQEEMKLRTGYYKRFAKCRRLSIEEQIEKIKNGEPYVIRFKSKGDFEEKMKYTDLAKGTIEISKNDLDEVIMKSDNLLPTYHFAHVIDDHLMHTTIVVRGEEWLPSVSKHIEMFEAFNFDVPKYLHTPLILKKEDGKVRKLSKRKDPEANMDYFKEQGYPKEAVIESLMTIMNSNYEEWHQQNPDKKWFDFTFKSDKMSPSGALYDLLKLDDISKNIISKMTKEELYNESYEWASIYGKELKDLIDKDKEYYINILNIEREQEKPRKDIEKYSSIYNHIWYMYDELYKDYEYEWMNITDIDEINKILSLYIEKYYNESDDKETWFNKIKELTKELGYADNMKEYKKNKELYKGNVADISTVLRVALTSKRNTPDLYEIMRLFGKDRIIKRYSNLK